MERSFGPETPILWYEPNAHTRVGTRNEREYLLWPAWAFRVVAPEVRDRTLNLVQIAVLGMLRASRLTSEELGCRLGLNPELIAFVVVELQTQGYLDARLDVTTSGVEALSEDEAGSAKLIAAWVFRDPWTGNLWPFLASHLANAQTHRKVGALPQLDLGTSGKPWYQRAWMQLPEEGESPHLPDAREILRASRRHARLNRRGQRLNTRDEDPGNSIQFSGIDLDRLSVVEPKAYPVFLTTYLYVPLEYSAAEFDWHACDFFHRGNNPELRGHISRVAQGSTGLTEVLDRLLGRSIEGGLEEFRSIVATRRSRAEMILERSFTLDIHKHSVSGAIIETIEWWHDVKELGPTMAGSRSRNVLAGCRRILEGLFAELAQKWSLKGLKVVQDVDILRAQIAVASKALGVTSVPSRFSAVRPQQLRSVVVFSEYWRLGPLVVATLLRAVGDPTHPMNALLRNAPATLEVLDEIAAQAGEAVHDSAVTTTIATLEVCVSRTFELVGKLLGLPYRELNGVQVNG